MMFFAGLRGETGVLGFAGSLLLLPILAPLFVMLVIGSGVLGWWAGPRLADIVTALGVFENEIDRLFFLGATIAFGAGFGWILLRAMRRTKPGRSRLGWLNVFAALPMGAGFVLLVFPPRSFPPSTVHVAAMIVGALWLADFQYGHRFKRPDDEAWW
jgi:hypothetical protein